MRIRYRARQFWHALTATPAPEDLDLARQVLSPAQMELFLKLQPNEQVHSLHIFRQLYQQNRSRTRPARGGVTPRCGQDGLSFATSGSGPGL